MERKLLPMKDKALSRPLRIEDRRAAAAFSDPLRRHLVLLCVAQPRSVSALAGLTGADLKRLHYHVTALQKLGLLIVARAQKRGGRPIKFYKAAAEAFFIPADLVPHSPSRALEDELRGALARLADLAHEGVLYHLDDDGKPRMRMVRAPAPANGAGGESWRILRLSRAEALELTRQIDAYLNAPRGGGEGPSGEYLIHFAIAPRAKTRGPSSIRPRRP